MSRVAEIENLEGVCRQTASETTRQLSFRMCSVTTHRRSIGRRHGGTCASQKRMVSTGGDGDGDGDVSVCGW